MNPTQAKPQTASYTAMSAQDLHPRQDLIDYLTEYAREKPQVAAMWCFGIGFILGWKLKPW